MDINNMLCVGRSRLSQFGKTNLPDSGSRTPEKTTLDEMNNQGHLSEKDLVARVSSNLSSGSLSPATKSILRGRVPSPKQGSPSSLRNVRFSDKDSDDEIMYAKIHVNENIQTDHLHKNKTSQEARGRGGFKLDFEENHTEGKQLEVHEIKTSTPRYNKSAETPSLDFHTPRGRQENRKSSQMPHPRGGQTPSFEEKSHFQTTQSKNQSGHKRERIIIDINIDRKTPTEQKYEPRARSEPKQTKSTGAKVRKNTTFSPDGSKIIQNMDLNLSARSNSPERKQPVVPDGNRIIQNLDLSSGDIATKFRSTASQTSSSGASSPRSPSPESPYQTPDIPDGSRIIKNMELNSLDSSLTSKSKSVQTNERPDGKKIVQNLGLKSESVQTMDIPDGGKITQNMNLTFTQKNCKNTSVEVQTLNPQALQEERFRSVPVQTVLDISEENSPNDSFDNSKSRSTAVQTQDPIKPKIPDGLQIIRNMEINQSEKPKHFTDSADDRKSLNSGNWSEFVRHLESYNPSSSSCSSVSVSEDEPPQNKKAEPVIVYDRNAPSPETSNFKAAVNQREKPAEIQRSSDRSARKFLESDAFTRHQFESVLREEGLLSKYGTGQKSSTDSSVSAKLLVDKAFAKTDRAFDIKEPTVNTVKPRSGSTAFIRQKNEQLGNNNQYLNRSGQKTVFARPNEYVDGTGLKSASDMSMWQESKQHRSDKENLGFTPIETYSFNPETLMKTAGKRACSTKKSVVEPFKAHVNSISTAKTNMSSAYGTKESISKNSFIQGLDLGPIPRSISSQRYSSLLPSAFETSKPGQYKTSLSRDYGHSSGFSEKSKLQDDFTTSSLGSFGFASVASSSERPMSMSGYRRSSYSHVTGHSSVQPSSDYQDTHSHYRPYSAPTTGSKIYPTTSTLSSSLKEMRTNALRKSAMHQFADHKRRPPAVRQSLSSSFSPSYQSRFDHKKTVHQTSKYSPNNSASLCETYMQRGLNSSYNNVTGASVPGNAYRSEGVAARSFSPRKVSPKRSNYLNALNDESNARPPSRERSRSRSRSRSPIPSSRHAYDTRYSTSHLVNRNTVNGLFANLDDDAIKYDETYEDRGNFDSVVSTGHLNPNVITSKGGKAVATDREPRALTRKPPIPSRMKTSRSSSNGRSRSRSADRKVREITKPSNEVKRENGHEATAKTSKTSPEYREKLHTSEKLGTAHDKLRGDNPFHGLGTVTVGDVPPGLANPECLYLGHDTIQKIIDEAKL